MKCRKCSQKAIINMRQHKLALCKTHYPEWVYAQTQRTIEKYRMFGKHDRILVAVSGGKDSLSLWDILWQLGYQADGLYIGLGIDDGIKYSLKSQRLTEQFADQRQLNLQVVDFQQTYGETIIQISLRSYRGKQKPCSVCGMAKRHVMNRVAREGKYDVLVTGHNLDDEAATLFGNTLTWSTDYLRRQEPLLLSRHEGLARKAKPLFRFYEREMTTYALNCGIEYIYEECPYAIGSKSIYYKEVLNELEEHRPGLKLAFFLSFLQAKQVGLFTSTPIHNQDMEIQDLNPDQGLNTCPSCKQPTTAPGLCSFCRLFEKRQN